MIDEESIRRKFESLKPAFDERVRRLWVATEAKEAGYGGITAVARATGVSSSTIKRGIKELENPASLPEGLTRKAGGGRKSATFLDPDLLGALDRLVEPTVRGDPESALRWTCKSTRNLARELRAQGYRVSHTLVAHLLREADYSLQSNRKSKEGDSHPDRNAQFEYINRKMTQHMKQGNPGISVDTKKKELVGDFKNAGREWRPKGTPEEVRTHDFIDPKLGKAIPYGVYDLRENAGWVSVGITHDTASFAVKTITHWWNQMGKKVYPKAKSLLITADSGGSNGARTRLWKWELQCLANRTGLTIHVCHFPPGTSKWNKIEHRLFSFITGNWRGQPLLTHAAIVNLIASTQTATGLRVKCRLDRTNYPKGVKVSDDQMRTINIKRHEFHGDWNYTIEPNNK